VPVPLPLPIELGDSIKEPRPQDCTINGAGWYNYWGPATRPAGADACINEGSLSGGTAASRSMNIPGYSNPPYDRGHIIGRQLGGSGSEPGSLFTQCLGVNRGAMRVFEDKIWKAVTEKKETVYYAVVLGYDSRPIPDTVSVFFAGSRGSAGSDVFSNVC